MLYTASGYDITINFYQHYVIERHTYAVNTCRMLLIDGVYTHVFCSYYAVISAVNQTYVVQLLYHVSDLLASMCNHKNDLSATRTV